MFRKHQNTFLYKPEKSVKWKHRLKKWKASRGHGFYVKIISIMEREEVGKVASTSFRLVRSAGIVGGSDMHDKTWKTFPWKRIILHHRAGVPWNSKPATTWRKPKNEKYFIKNAYQEFFNLFSPPSRPTSHPSFSSRRHICMNILLKQGKYCVSVLQIIETCSHVHEHIWRALRWEFELKC